MKKKLRQLVAEKMMTEQELLQVKVKMGIFVGSHTWKFAVTPMQMTAAWFPV